MAVANPTTPFVWGAGGAMKTPEQIAREREIAAALMQSGSDFSPVDHWMQGAARAAQAGAGALKDRWAGEAETAGREGFQGGVSGATTATTANSGSMGQQARCGGCSAMRRTASGPSRTIARSRWRQTVDHRSGPASDGLIFHGDRLWISGFVAAPWGEQHLPRGSEFNAMTPS